MWRSSKSRHARGHGPGEKAEFLRLRGELGTVVAAADRMGLARSTCFAWATEAGIHGRPGRAHPGRRDYDRLRREGVDRAAAAAAVGVNVRTARDWDSGIRRSGPRRIHPDGSVREYKRTVPATAALPAPAPSSNPVPGPAPIPDPAPVHAVVPVAALEKEISDRFLSLK